MSKQLEELDDDGMRDAVKQALEEAANNRSIPDAIVSGDVPPEELLGYLQIVCEDDPEAEEDGGMVTKVTSVGSMSAIVSAMSSFHEMLMEQSLKDGDTATLTALIEVSVTAAAMLARASNSGFDEDAVRHRILQLLSELTNGAVSLRDNSTSNTVH